MLPAAVRTYGPRGQTPILRVPLSRDHLSVISAISPDGELVLMAQERALTSADVARFLRHLLGILPHPLPIIWDGGPIHRGQPVKNLLAEVGRERMLVGRSATRPSAYVRSPGLSKAASAKPGTMSEPKPR